MVSGFHTRYYIPHVSCMCRHRRVAFLECDVGQTEFTPSGVVSLAFVSQPLIGKCTLVGFMCVFLFECLLGPACTHQRTPERFVWVHQYYYHQIGCACCRHV